MNENQFNVTATGMIAFAIAAVLITLMALIYQYNRADLAFQYNRADLAFQEKAMLNGYVQVMENGSRLWKPAGVKIEVEKK
jgi:hypothetical protein